MGDWGVGVDGGQNTMHSIPSKKEAIQNLEKSNNVEDKIYIFVKRIDMFVEGKLKSLSK